MKSWQLIVVFVVVNLLVSGFLYACDRDNLLTPRHVPDVIHP